MTPKTRVFHVLEPPIRSRRVPDFLPRGGNFDPSKTRRSRPKKRKKNGILGLVLRLFRLRGLPPWGAAQGIVKTPPDLGRAFPRWSAPTVVNIVLQAGGVPHLRSLHGQIDSEKPENPRFWPPAPGPRPPPEKARKNPVFRYFPRYPSFHESHFLDPPPTIPALHRNSSEKVKKPCFSRQTPKTRISRKSRIFTKIPGFSGKSDFSRVQPPKRLKTSPNLQFLALSGHFLTARPPQTLLRPPKPSRKPKKYHFSELLDPQNSDLDPSQTLLRPSSDHLKTLI